MARKAKKSTEIAPVEVSTPIAATPAPSAQPKLIVAQRKFDRWYVYFQGVPPKDNIGLGCKSAKSALRYMYMMKRKHGAVISQNVYDRLKFEAEKEG